MFFGCFVVFGVFEVLRVWGFVFFFVEFWCFVVFGVFEDFVWGFRGFEGLGF